MVLKGRLKEESEQDETEEVGKPGHGMWRMKGVSRMRQLLSGAETTEAEDHECVQLFQPMQSGHFL